MKFYSFEAGKRLRLGLEHSGQLVDLPLAHFLLTGTETPAQGSFSVPPEMTAFIRSGERALEAAQTVLVALKKRRAFPAGDQVFYSPDSVRLLAPVPRPGKIVIRSLSSGTEIKREAYTAKLPSSLTGHLSEIRSSEPLEGEIQMAAAIGHKLKNVTESEAAKAIFGCTLLVNIRHIAKNPYGSFVASNHDTFCPMGPRLITLDELEQKSHSIKCRVNQRDVLNFSDCEILAELAKTIARLSQYMTFDPGDLVSCAFQSRAVAEFHPGDTITVESPFGVLENRVVAE